MSVEVSIVNEFRGLDVRPWHAGRSERRALDTPRELVNLMVDDNGHLYYPPADAEPVHTFAASIYRLRYLQSPRCILVQLTNGEVHAVELGSGRLLPEPLVTNLLTTLPHSSWPIWAASADTFGLFGYAARGSDVGGDVYKVTDTATATSIAATEPFTGEVSYSQFYKGRRFTVSRGRIVRYSELNDFENFPDANQFPIGGDDEGDSYESYPGVVQGMVSWEDSLLFFLANSVWTLTGSGPDNWHLRQAMTNVGNSQAMALSRTDGGVLTYAGVNIEDPGVYLFTGSQTHKVSEQIDPLMLTLQGLTLFSTIAHGYYVLCKPQLDPDEIQAFLYNMRTQTWSTFDGWVNAAAVLSTCGLFISSGSTLYLNAGRAFTRAPARTGKITLGWVDDGLTAGQARFIAVKLAGRKVGLGSPTVQITARVPGGAAEVVSPAVPLADTSFDNVVVPINLRGHAVELELVITPTDDSDSVVIESLQLVHSRKGEKVSRA